MTESSSLESIYGYDALPNTRLDLSPQIPVDRYTHVSHTLLARFESFIEPGVQDRAYSALAKTCASIAD